MKKHAIHLLGRLNKLRDQLPLIQQKLNFQFQHADTYLLNALIHPSFYQELKDSDLLPIKDLPFLSDNQRLEFFGDSILGFCVTSYLYDLDYLKEGKMTEIRSNLVNNKTLAESMNKMAITQHILMTPSVSDYKGHKGIADVFEAIIAAIYLDSGKNLQKTQHWLNLYYIPPIDHLIIDTNNTEQKNADWKSKLQIYTQKYDSEHSLPMYHGYKKTGEDHQLSFTCKVTVKNETFQGSGTSKKSAEKNAAKKCYQYLLNKKNKF